MYSFFQNFTPTFNGLALLGHGVHLVALGAAALVAALGVDALLTAGIRFVTFIDVCGNRVSMSSCREKLYSENLSPWR